MTYKLNKVIESIDIKTLGYIPPPKATLPCLSKRTNNKYFTHKASIVAVCDSFLQHIYFVAGLPAWLFNVVCNGSHFINLHKCQRFNLETKPADLYLC